MKVYIDFEDLDAEDMPSSISNKYNLQVRTLNGGSDYKNIKIISLSEHDKQVRKELCDEIREEAEIFGTGVTGILGYIITIPLLNQIEKGKE